MNINFVDLSEAHFPLMLKWLESEHVKAWWDSDTCWTAALIEEKYAGYVAGYKLEQGKPQSIQAYIIQLEQQPIGYIQLYNAYDFARVEPLVDLPPDLAAFDIFLGEQSFLQQGVGSTALKESLEKFGKAKYTHVFADPAKNNLAAINTYKKVGFVELKQTAAGDIWMLKEF